MELVFDPINPQTLFGLQIQHPLRQSPVPIQSAQIFFNQPIPTWRVEVL